MDQLENKIELLKHKKDDKEYNELVDLCFLLFNIIKKVDKNLCIHCKNRKALPKYNMEFCGHHRYQYYKKYNYF